MQVIRAADYLNVDLHYLWLRKVTPKYKSS